MSLHDDATNDFFRVQDTIAREDPCDLSSPERVKAQLAWRERQLATSTIVQFATIADRAGINITDLMCVGILDVLGPTTPGHLSTLTGLSTGSVTTLVDRMERAGYVCRIRDEDDRRRIHIHLNREALASLEESYRLLNESYWAFLDRFSPDELKVVIRYLDGLIPFMGELNDALRGQRDRETAE